MITVSYRLQAKVHTVVPSSYFQMNQVPYNDNDLVISAFSFSCCLIVMSIIINYIDLIASYDFRCQEGTAGMERLHISFIQRGVRWPMVAFAC